MICKHCGKEIGDTQKFCGYCGWSVGNELDETEYLQEEEEKQKNSQNTLYCGECGEKIEGDAEYCPNCGKKTGLVSKKKKKKPFILLLAAGLLIAVAIIWSVRSNAENKKSIEIEKVQQGFKDYFDIKKHVSEITSEYKNSDGFIKKEKINDSITAVGQYAKELYDSRIIKDYEITEGESVWIQFNSGVEYIYIPVIEGMDSSTISTYQPCLAMYSSEFQELGNKCVDETAGGVSSNLNEYSFENNYDNETITLDLLKDIGKSELVIWHGHGGYNTRTHSFLMTGLELDEAAFLLDPIYYIQNLGYTNDYLTGRIVCSDSGYVMVTSKFFEKYLHNLKSNIIYLGACDTGKDDVLAKTFINKGAKTVIANTETIPTKYNLNMIASVFNELEKISENQYQDVETALDRAKTINKKLYDQTGCISDVRIWGKTDTRLSNQKPKNESKTKDNFMKDVFPGIWICDRSDINSCCLLELGENGEFKYVVHYAPLTDGISIPRSDQGDFYIGSYSYLEGSDYISIDVTVSMTGDLKNPTKSTLKDEWSFQLKGDQLTIKSKKGIDVVGTDGKSIFYPGYNSSNGYTLQGKTPINKEAVIIEKYMNAVSKTDGSDFRLSLDADVSVSASDGSHQESMMEYIDMSANIMGNNTDSMRMSGNCSVEADGSSMAYNFYYEDGIVYCENTRPYYRKGIAETSPVKNLATYQFELNEDNVRSVSENNGILNLVVDGNVLNIAALLEETLRDTYNCHCDSVSISLSTDDSGRPSVITLDYTVTMSVSGVDATADYYEVLTFSNYGDISFARPSDLETYTGQQSVKKETEVTEQTEEMSEETEVMSEKTEEETVFPEAVTLNDITNYSDSIVRTCEEWDGYNVDAEGNEYFGATLFDASLNASYSYALNGQFESIEGVFFIPQIAEEGKNEWIEMYVDDELVYEYDGLSNDDSPIYFDLDLSGADELTIKTGNNGTFSSGYIIIADTVLTYSQ